MEKQKQIPISEEVAMEKERQDRCCSLEDELTCRRDRVAVKKRVNRPNRYDHHVFVDEITDNDPRIVFGEDSRCRDWKSLAREKIDNETAGESGSEKASVIRKLLNGKLFNDRILRTTTSTVVKLQNSDRVRITTESDTGNIKEKYFTEKCYLERKDGVKSFYKSFELKPKVLNQSVQLSEESSAEATSNNLLPAPNFSYQDRKYSGNKNVLKDM